MLTVVFIYHGPLILRAWLLDSLRRQEANELILIDNTKAAYRSPAPAFNSIEPSGDYVLFVQRRISPGPRLLAQGRGPTANLGAGLTGIGEEAGGRVVSSSFSGSPPTPPDRFVEKPLEVQTVDEFAFFVPSKLLERVIDESVIDSFHLYAVDYCLTVKALGMRNYVLPLPAYHAAPALCPGARPLGSSQRSRRSTTEPSRGLGSNGLGGIVPYAPR